jgi:hypothetical protein
MSEFKIHDSAESLVQDMQQQDAAPAPETTQEAPQAEPQAQAPTTDSQATEQSQPTVENTQPQAEQPIDDGLPDNVIDINGHKAYVTDAPEQPNIEEQSAGQPQYTMQDMDAAVSQYLSERLGVGIDSLDQLAQFTQAPQIDERVQAIAKFVQETGRDPQDWFRYQSLNPSEMDDMTAVRVQMASKYPNLSYEEVETLIANKYSYDANLTDESEIKMKQLQLKIDAQEAKQTIEGMRNQYAAPQRQEQQQQQQAGISREWVEAMASEVGSFEGVEFDLGNGKMFSYNVDDNYRNQLVQKNASLDKFFNQYVGQDGSWDYDMLSAHQTVLDNVDNIVKAAYQQGLGDGQKNLVNKAANITPGSQQAPANQPSGDDAVSQVLNYMGNNSGLKFNI